MTQKVALETQKLIGVISIITHKIEWITRLIIKNN